MLINGQTTKQFHTKNCCISANSCLSFIVAGGGRYFSKLHVCPKVLYHGVGGCKFANIEKYFWYFSMKKGGPGCIFANSEKYFWYFFTFFFYFFQQNLRYFRYFCQIFKVVSGSYTYLYVILFNTWLFYILVNI